jgi:hypothetical protein
MCVKGFGKIALFGGKPKCLRMRKVIDFTICLTSVRMKNALILVALMYWTITQKILFSHLPGVCFLVLWLWV